MLATIALALAVASFVAICTLISYMRWNYGSLEKLGIPVVKPHVLLGSRPNQHLVVVHENDYDLFKTHGEVFGVYEGRKAKIFVCDPEIARQVFIKEADKFPNRGFGDEMNLGAMGQEWMDFCNDEKWKKVRSSFTPMFTSSKLKKMSRDIIQVTQDFVGMIKEDVKKSSNESIQDYNLFQDIYLLLVDVIARCTLNIKVQNPRDPQNDFAKALLDLFQGASEITPSLRKLAPSLPFLRRFGSPGKSEDAISFFEKIYKQVVKQRIESGEKNDDFIDFIIELLKKSETNEFKRLGVTEFTIIANAVEFYIAGQDSMAMAISMLAFYMSKEPEIERKLHEEVDAYFERNGGKVTYETLHALPYLNACLQEALRLHPTFVQTDRKCAEDVDIKGIKIKKGMSVVVPIWAYNRNPKYFPDPETFDPERFMPHNKDKLNPMAFSTFGWGPRMCIGMRFALEGMMITSLYLFQAFKFTAKPHAKITYLPGTGFLALSTGVPLNIHLR